MAALRLDERTNVSRHVFLIIHPFDGIAIEAVAEDVIALHRAQVAPSRSRYRAGHAVGPMASKSLVRLERFQRLMGRSSTCSGRPGGREVHRMTMIRLSSDCRMPKPCSSQRLATRVHRIGGTSSHLETKVSPLLPSLTAATEGVWLMGRHRVQSDCAPTVGVQFVLPPSRADHL